MKRRIHGAGTLFFGRTTRSVFGGLVLLALYWPCQAAVVDRVALVIDKKIVTESEILDELRLTALLNNQPLDLGPEARRAAADRLVDQELIHREMMNSNYAQPAVNTEVLLRQFRQQRFPSAAAYRAALDKYGVGEEQLKQRLAWQTQAIRFTDFRFRSQPELGPPSADRAADGANSVDQQMEAWLKQARSDTRITFKPEAFR